MNPSSPELLLIYSFIYGSYVLLALICSSGERQLRIINIPEQESVLGILEGSSTPLLFPTWKVVFSFFFLLLALILGVKCEILSMDIRA